MKRNKGKVMGSGMSAADGAKESGALSETEVIRLTDETAKDLLDKTELKTETAIWTRRGSVIRGYVRKLQPRGKHTTPDPYALLAEHQDIHWSANQLRAFVDALELWEQFGEGAPDLPMTVYSIIASSDLTIDEKKNLLTKAMEQHLSSRDVKNQLRVACGDVDAKGKDSVPVVVVQEGATGSPKSKTMGDCNKEPLSESSSDGGDEGDDGAPENQELDGVAVGTAIKPQGSWKKVVADCEKLYADLSAFKQSEGMPETGDFSKLKEVAEQILAYLDSFDMGTAK
jgi:hypothetical protein